MESYLTSWGEAYILWKKSVFYEHAVSDPVIRGG